MPVERWYVLNLAHLVLLGFLASLRLTSVGPRPLIDLVSVGRSTSLHHVCVLLRLLTTVGSIGLRVHAQMLPRLFDPSVRVLSRVLTPPNQVSYMLFLLLLPRRLDDRV